MVQRQLLLAVLMASMVLVPALPIYSQKNLDNPDKIGHRTVARKSIISPENEIAIGKEYARRFESTVELVQDPAIQRYVTTVAENVVRNSDWKGPTTVKVVKSSDVDSLSLPGGFIYLKSGLLLSAENEDEIAGAIAHQVAHAAARHWATDMTKMTILQYAMLPLIFVPSASTQPASPTTRAMGITMACSGFSPSRGVSLATPLAFVKLRRQDELEADYLGLQYMYKAGYAPSVYVALLRRLAMQHGTWESVPESFQDMPPVSERVAKAEEEIRKVLPNAPQPAKPSPEFTLMKSRL
jgi:predicted Zn-dependent protease